MADIKSDLSLILADQRIFRNELDSLAEDYSVAEIKKAISDYLITNSDQDEALANAPNSIDGLWNALNLNGDNKIVIGEKEPQIIDVFGGDTQPTPPPSTPSDIPDSATVAGLTATDDIDEDGFDKVKQRSLGNCCFLSTLNALSVTEQGRENLDKMITKGENGTYYIVFPLSPDEVYEITPQELEQDSMKSEGDPVMQAFELAAKKYSAKHPEWLNRDPKSTDDPLAGIGVKDTAKLFGAREELTFKDGEPDLANKLRAYAEEHGPDVSMVFGSSVGQDGEMFTGQGEGAGMHAYAITNIDVANNTITYENPWDMGKTYTISIDEFVALPGLSSGGALSFGVPPKEEE